MSTTTLRLEGPDLGVLLDEIRSRFGDDANVVAANRCRSGGVGGFFARESFEVFVEPPSAQAARAPVGPGPAEDHRDALDQMMRAADLADGLAASLRPGRPGRVIEASPVQAATGARTAGGGGARSFAGVLDEAISTIDHHATPTKGTAGGAGATEARGAAPDAEAGSRRSRRGARRAQKESSTPEQPRGRWARRRARRRGELIDLVRLETGDELVAMRAPERVGPARATPNPRTAPSSGLVSTEALRRLGVPSRWLDESDGGMVALAGIVARIPQAPSLDFVGGSVVAFVGPADLALRTARAVATALRQDADRCVLLSPTNPPPGTRCTHVRSLDDLALERETWTSPRDVQLVVVDAGFARADVAWARIALGALAPQSCWGVVEATRKPEDIRDWVAGSGAIEALAVFGVGDTQAPATTLAAGVPVARLDGKPATPDAWRKLLEDRLATVSRRGLGELAIP